MTVLPLVGVVRVGGRATAGGALSVGRASGRQIAASVWRLLDGVALPPSQPDVGAARDAVWKLATVVGELRPWLNGARRAGTRRRAPSWLGLADRYATHATVEVARWAPVVTTEAALWDHERAERFRSCLQQLEDARRQAAEAVRAALGDDQADHTSGG